MSGEAARPGARERLGPVVPYALVLVVGLAIAVGVVLTADRDPLVFAVPPLVLTAVILAILRLTGGGRDDDGAMGREARATGFADEGLRPIPQVTPLLAGVRAPARVLRGELFPGGPQCRLARAGDRAVAITDAPVRAVDAAAREWLDEHPLRPDAAIEDRTLVVAAAGDAPLDALLAVVRELYARLAP